MRFTLAPLVLALSTLATAAPHENAVARSPNGLRGQDHEAIRWHVPHSMTVQEAQSKCGNQAQLSCCNKATYAGDTKDVNAGALSNLIGAGSGADGLGVFDQCSELHVQSKYHFESTLFLLLTSSKSQSSSPFPFRISLTSVASRTWSAAPTTHLQLATTSSVLVSLASLWDPSFELSGFGRCYSDFLGLPACKLLINNQSLLIFVTVCLSN